MIMRKLTIAALLSAIALSPLAAAGGSGAPVSGAAGEGALGGGVAIPAPLPAGVGARSVDGVTNVGSATWSGYAQVGTKTQQFTGVYSEWIVPTVKTKGSGDQYASDWVGIDGASKDNNHLVQAGTMAESIDGKALYFAWTEILPASLVVAKKLGTIHPGDPIFGQVREIATNRWVMFLSDGATGKSFTRTVSYTTPGKQAEVVHERPLYYGIPSTLAQTNNVVFADPAVDTMAPGHSPYWQPLGQRFPGVALDRIFMNSGGANIASPSALSPDSCFTVADGNKPPKPPVCG
jgi:hypothetical protein